MGRGITLAHQPPEALLLLGCTQMGIPSEGAIPAVLRDGAHLLGILCSIPGDWNSAPHPR